MYIPKNLALQFFIFNIIFLISNCQIRIPLKYYPAKKYNNTTPMQVMNNIIQQNVHLILEIDYPKQIVEIPLKFDNNDFYLVDNASIKTNKYDFSDFKAFDSSISQYLSDTDYEEPHHGDYFDYAVYKKDIFYFNNSNYTIEFYLPYSYDRSDSGGIGMLLEPTSDLDDATKDRTRTFTQKMREKKLARTYHWSIFYNTRDYKKEEEGFILMGCLPHEIETDLSYYGKGFFKGEDEKRINIVVKNSLIENIFEIDLLFAYEGNNISKIIDDFPSGYTDYKKIKVEYNNGGVRAPTKLKPYYERVFEKYISTKDCFNDTFKINMDTETFYYCKNDKNLLKKIKDELPTVNLRSNDLTFNFTLGPDDLFVEENNYIFCLLYFSTSTKSDWEMGKPFVKKYLFTFNYDEKYMSFYVNSGNKQEEDGDKNGGSNGGQSGEKKRVSVVILVIAIIVTIIVVTILFILLFKFYLYDKFFRKRRANELDDDDYDYRSKAEKENPSLNID